MCIISLVSSPIIDIGPFSQNYISNGWSPLDINSKTITCTIKLNPHTFLHTNYVPFFKKTNEGSGISGDVNNAYRQLLEVHLLYLAFCQAYFCQLSYFLFNFAKWTLFWQGVKQYTESRGKNINKLSTFVSSSSEHCAKHWTFHTAVSENTVPGDRLLRIQHTNHFDYDHTHLSLFLKSPHCCQWHLNIIITNPATPNNSI